MKWLLFSWKNIIWSDDRVFQSMENLHFVEIRKNKLSSFPLEILSCCPVLASLNLSNNEVSLHPLPYLYTNHPFYIQYEIKSQDFQVIMYYNMNIS